MIQGDLDKLIGHLFRTESGKMVSVLTRLLGFDNFQTAEDIVQDTLMKAMTTWRFGGVPENPAAWLYTVAKRKAIDVLRERNLHQTLNQKFAAELSSEWTLAPTVNQFFLENEIEDSQLRMIFACCHPAIPYDSQIAFTLKTLCGLSVAEIAKSFLTSEETIAKRLFRARDKIRQENISMDVPTSAEMPERLDAVHHTLYLLFNEGYHSSHPDHLIREDLCTEAMRLTHILTNHSITAMSSSFALLALMCLQAAREDSRLDAAGNIVLLKDQDRTRWNLNLIKTGLLYLDEATKGDEMNAYQLEAAIAATHATAASFRETNWRQIVELYTELEKIKPGPIVSLNKAIARGYAFSPAEGIDALMNIRELGNYDLYYTALGEFYEQMNKTLEARESFQSALQLTQAPAQKAFLQKKISQLS